MKKHCSAILSLLLTSGLVNANAEELPLPNDDRFVQIKEEIDQFCHSTPPCEESRLYCFLEQVHTRRETAVIDEPLFRRLLNEGQMRLAFRRGFQEGLLKGKEQCLPPHPGPRPSPRPSPSATPAPTPDSGEKVAICHRPPGNPSNARTLKVGASAVSAHLAHGDSLGECSSDGSDSKSKGEKSNGSSKSKSGEKSKQKKK